MGCDIHLFVETKNDAGAWELTPVLATCHYCNGEGVVTRSHRPNGECFMCDGGGTVATYGHREYEIFGMLAGVRGTLKPIAEPRGRPNDMSKELAAIYAEDDARTLDPEACWAKHGAFPGEHSASWLTLRQILDHGRPEFNYKPVFFSYFLPALEKLGDPDDVRIVFDFDN